MNQKVLLEMKKIHKRFPGVYALRDVDFQLYEGEVHALLGENGAGKSTLIKVLGGIYEKDEGDLFIEGKKTNIKSVKDARDCGINIIHQELILVPFLSIAENIFVNREPMRHGQVDYKTMYKNAQKYLNDFGLELNAHTLVEELTIAQQQMVEIVKAISFNAKIIVMDEPTSSISEKEVNALFEHIRKLKQKGIGIIYISHRMAELEEIADRVTVLRDGMYVGTREVRNTTNDELIALMVGREMTSYYTKDCHVSDEIIMKVTNLKSYYIHDVSFELKKGEILGFAGLIGAGRSETAKAIFGIDKLIHGTIEINGRNINIKKPMEAIKKGIALVPESRREEGIVPMAGVGFNTTIKVLKDFIKGFVNVKKENEIISFYNTMLRTKTSSYETPIASLSGGNQQKVVIASWLATKPDILILDEPTRGIDVGAKAEIYQIMNELTSHGMSIIMISSELPEILNMSDRIIVMKEGTISGVLSREEATQEQIMQYAVSID